MTTGRRSSRSVHSVNVRRRSYVALVNAHDSNTSNTRETLVTPAKGKRIRLLRVRVIQEQADAARIKRESVQNGMRTLRQSALQKLAEGQTSFEEVVRVTGL